MRRSALGAIDADGSAEPVFGDNGSVIPDQHDTIHG
jgi:hypothetical protein